MPHYDNHRGQIVVSTATVKSPSRGYVQTRYQIDTGSEVYEVDFYADIESGEPLKVDSVHIDADGVRTDLDGKVPQVLQDYLVKQAVNQVGHDE